MSVARLRGLLGLFERRSLAYGGSARAGCVFRGTDGRDQAWRAGTATSVGLGLQCEKGDFDYRNIRIKENDSRGAEEGCSVRREVTEATQSGQPRARFER